MITAEEARNIPIDTNIEHYIEEFDNSVIILAQKGQKSTVKLIPIEILTEMIEIIKRNGYIITNVTSIDENLKSVSISWE